VSYEVVYRSMTPEPLDTRLNPPDPRASLSAMHWHHDSYHADRASAETRASQLILSGLQVRIREVS
jgi:hypothetical protein